MITGAVDEEGVPIVQLTVAGQTWPAVVDTGFSGDLELPLGLRRRVNARVIGRMRSLLASGQSIEENRYLVDFEFDGEQLVAEATFAPTQEILLGTHLLRHHRLEIDFVAQSVVLDRVS